MKCTCSLLFFVFALSTTVRSQGILPDFSARELSKGKIQITWNNPYSNCIQLAIQRSSDSSKDFRTIFSSISPQLPSNGYVDNRPLAQRAYYRIFYVLEGGAYFFSVGRAVDPTLTPVVVIPPRTEKEVIVLPKPKDLISIYVKNAVVFRLSKSEYQQFRDSINSKTKDALHRINENSIEWKPAKPLHKTELINVYNKDVLIRSLTGKAYQQFKDSVATGTKDTLFTIDQWRVQLHKYIAVSKDMSIFRNDTLLMQLETAQYKKFKDSIATRTRDTLFAIDNNRVDIHPFTVKYAWKASAYIFTNAKGYVTIMLPLVKQHKYHVIFYEEDGSELFRIKTIKDAELILDKTDFIHAGWFSFELFEDEKLKFSRLTSPDSR
jgi:3D (Asp-Asp-Asp) domain-containing protein